jgi:hypothetical protein
MSDATGFIKPKLTSAEKNSGGYEMFLWGAMLIHSSSFSFVSSRV